MTNIEKEVNKMMCELIEKYCEKTDTGKWGTGDFADIARVEKGLRGEVGEDFVEGVLQQMGYTDAQRKDNRRGEYDITANGFRIEVKTASEDIHNSFQFNSIRHDVDYDFLFVVGIAPDNIYFRIYKKKDIPQNLPPMAKNTERVYKFTHTKNKLYELCMLEAEVKKMLGEPKS